jgi:hypothetical protein
VTVRPPRGLHQKRKLSTRRRGLACSQSRLPSDRISLPTRNELDRVPWKSSLSLSPLQRTHSTTATTTTPARATTTTCASAAEFCPTQFAEHGHKTHSTRHTAHSTRHTAQFTRNQRGRAGYARTLAFVSLARSTLFTQLERLEEVERAPRILQLPPPTSAKSLCP